MIASILDIGQGKVGHVDLICSPLRLAFGAQRRWYQRPPEEGQLIAKALPTGGYQVAGVVPPLGLIVQVGSMIRGKHQILGSRRPEKAFALDI